MRILIVEDDIKSEKVIHKMLSLKDNWDIAKAGKEAIGLHS